MIFCRNHGNLKGELSLHVSKSQLRYQADIAKLAEQKGHIKFGVLPKVIYFPIWLA